MYGRGDCVSVNQIHGVWSPGVAQRLERELMNKIPRDTIDVVLQQLSTVRFTSLLRSIIIVTH